MRDCSAAHVQRRYILRMLCVLLLAQIPHARQLIPAAPPSAATLRNQCCLHIGLRLSVGNKQL